MPNINVSNLSFSYDGNFEKIFENVNFNIDTSWKLGLIGRNGKGKTTLLNLLMGNYEFSGNISSTVNFSYFPYEVFRQERDVMEIIGDDWQIYKELSLLSMSHEVLFRPFNTLSEGEKTKVLLASMFIKENNFLLIDEPTNHLDVEGRKILANYLKKKQGFILVSHDRNFLDNSVDHIMSINKSNIEIVSGNFTSWNENKQMKDNFEVKQNDKFKSEIKRLLETAKEKSRWSDKIEATKSKKVNPEVMDKGYIGHQAAKMMKRAKSIEKRVGKQILEKEKLLKNMETVRDLKVIPLEFHSNLLLHGEQITIYYDSYRVVNNLNFQILQGQKINIKGSNGSGKTSLIKMILGEDIKYTGNFFKAKGLTISYISQDTSILNGKLSEFEKNEQLNVSLFRSILQKLNFSRDTFERPIETYSEGEKKKILIAKSLSQTAHIYIWDEPLNYIDVLSRVQIEKLIKSNEMTLLFVEHDKMFCENISNNVIQLD